MHQTSINCTGYRYLKEGEEVSYDVAKTDRGLSATNVSAPDGSPLIREDNRGPV